LKTVQYFTFFVVLLLTTDLYSQIPQGYYDAAEYKADQALRDALHNIIDDHQGFSYTSSGTDTWDILKEADADPNNPNNVLLIYTRESVDGDQEYAGGSGWNREHVWAKSRGDFGTRIPEGTDVHNLRASNIGVNSTRLNYAFDDCTSNSCDETYGNFYSSSSLIFEPRDEDKGDVARIIFYMDVRYEGDSGEEDLEMVDYTLSTSSKLPYHGIRSTLLQWHQDDPVDDFERNRNDVIYSYQGNRNPFIDHPNLVDYLWGEQQQVQWSSTLSTPMERETTNIVYPNPSHSGYVNINSGFNPNHIELFDVQGKKVNDYDGDSKQIKTPSAPGIYFLRFHFDRDVIHKKILVLHSR
jgi:endonuclease I